MGRAEISMLAGGIIGLVVATRKAHDKPWNYDLVPQTLYVEMEKVEARASPVVIQIEKEQLRQIRWIRIATR